MRFSFQYLGRRLAVVIGVMTRRASEPAFAPWALPAEQPEKRRLLPRRVRKALPPAPAQVDPAALLVAHEIRRKGFYWPEDFRRR